MLADGRRINYGKNGITIGQNGYPSSRTNPAAPFNTSSSALTNSFMKADANQQYGYPPGEKYSQLDRRPSMDGIPTIDTTYSHTGSQYGSPREEDPTRLTLGLSPITANGLSVLDAPLPASFDSNGISHAARYPAGPWPSSVPSAFGLESPSPSLNSAKDNRTSEALKSLHRSAFGANDHLSSTVTPSSPPTQQTDEYYGKRQMHSSRYAKPKLLSSSAPRAIIGGMAGIDRDWDAEFPFLEEDYVPDNLKDLLTPAEKARRGSRAADEDTNGHRTPNGVLGTSGTGTPNAEANPKFGSPLAASPGRWGSMFQRQRDDDDAKRHALATSGAFGHVGSPLRNSMLNEDLMRPHGSRSGSVEGLSALTQQLNRTRLDAGGDGSPHLRPAVSGRPTNGRAGERHVSSGSMSSSARYTTPIGEEEGEFVFSMDEDGDSTVRARKRTSGFGPAMAIWSNGNASTSGKKDDSSRVVDGVGGR